MFPHVPRSGRVFASRTSHAGTPHQAKRGAKVTSVFPAFFAPFRIQPRCGQSFALVCMPPCPPEQGQSKTVSGSKKFGKLAPQQRFCALKHPFSASHFHRNGHRGPGSRSNGSCIIPLLSPSTGLEPAISLSLSGPEQAVCSVPQSGTRTRDLSLSGPEQAVCSFRPPRAGLEPAPPAQNRQISKNSVPGLEPTTPD